jgi:hypothetical protein
MNVFKACNFILTDNEWKQPKDPSEVETILPWDWYWDEESAAAAAAAGATAPSVLLSFDGVQPFVTAALSLGPWLLPLLSLFVGMFHVLGFRPFERLDRLFGFWRCAVTMVVLVASVSFLAVWTAPAEVIQACAEALIIRVVLGLARAAWDWMWWTLHRLVDLLGGGLAFLITGFFVHDRHDVKALSGMLMMWAIGRGILYGACSCLPMS